ncbi:MAG TPA: SRPBCC domain-containing protein [Gemmatimonadales bacterium]|nr:SRPBCC domain-containing protein [Gemmatimonadales bacterium]
MARPERVFQAWTTPQEMKQWTPRQSWCIPGVGRTSRRPRNLGDRRVPGPR